MTDKQKDKVFKEITDLDEFIIKANSKQDIYLNETIRISFGNIHNNIVEIAFPETTEHISAVEFISLKREIIEQKNGDINFNEIKKKRLHDMEFNINDELKTFLITENYVMNLIYGSDISSAQTWYIRQLKELLRLFEMNYKLLYKEKMIATKEEFSDLFLKGVYKFESIEKELEKYEIRKIKTLRSK